MDALGPLLDRNTTEEVWVDFWPRYSDPTKAQCTVEPDFLLYIGEQVYVIESKRHR